MYNFRPTPIWIWNEHKGYNDKNFRNEKNTYMEHLEYNEQEQNVKIFLAHVNLSTYVKNFIDLKHPRHTVPNFMDPRYSHHFFDHAACAKIWTTPFMLPTLISRPWLNIGKKQGNKHMLYLLSKTLLLVEKSYKYLQVQIWLSWPLQSRDPLASTHK